MIVTGSRDYKGDGVWAWLDHLDPDVVVEGGAHGADRMAREWCAKNGKECRTIYAAWNGLGKSAGPARNVRMIKQYGDQAECVLAFPLPGSRGTQHCMGVANARGVKVINGAASLPPPRGGQ